MHENEIAKQIVDATLRAHMALGPGLLESVYQAALVYELEKRGLHVSPQQAIPVVYESVRIETGFLCGSGGGEQSDRGDQGSADHSPGT
jgi:GxxExxY protein